MRSRFASFLAAGMLAGGLLGAALPALAEDAEPPAQPWTFTAGKVDFAPVVAIGLVFLLAEFAARALNFLYLRLPF